LHRVCPFACDSCFHPRHVDAKVVATTMPVATSPVDRIGQGSPERVFDWD
jgi:hypothetical protein